MKPTLEDLLASANLLAARSLEGYEIPECCQGAMRTDIWPEKNGIRVIELQASRPGMIRPLVLCRIFMDASGTGGCVEVGPHLKRKAPGKTSGMAVPAC